MYTYDIRIAGHLDGRWLQGFEGLDVSSLPVGETRIRGPLDQAALHGMLNRIRDLGLVLISVQRMSDERTSPATNPAEQQER